jgi:BirA family biotin operon repressor/biotin-[acetyl-CoA-carboxylase] ligase
MQSELNETAVQAELSTRWLGRNYRYVATIGSTNESLKMMLDAGDEHEPAHGTLLLADYQSQGKGRLDRRWEAPPRSSLLLSILFRPNWPGQQAQWLTMLASLAAAEAMEAHGRLAVGVKWPNDLVIKVASKWHKVSGMLLEGSINDAGQLESAILGIGMNVNVSARHLPEAATPATSLLAATGQPIARLQLLTDFLQRLETYYDAADNGRSPQPAWRERLITLGQRVLVTHIGRSLAISGIAIDTDAWGQLLVKDDVGQLHTIAAGDVTLREAIA